MAPERKTELEKLKTEYRRLAERQEVIFERVMELVAPVTNNADDEGERIEDYVVDYLANDYADRMTATELLESLEYGAWPQVII